MKVVLELQEQLANVRRVTVRHDIVIGRGSDCNLRLSAPQMSRRHCFLRVGREGVSVTDLDSSNGTYVNNKRIKPGERVELVTGSILSLGPVSFIVQVKEDSGSTTKNEGERSRKTSKSASGASESSTIVNSAAAIMAEEFKSKPPLQYSVEQAGASAEAHEETARIKSDQARDAVGKRTSSAPMQSRAEEADIASPPAKKTTSVSTPATSPVAESTAKAKPADSSLVDSGVESLAAEDVQSSDAVSSWLTDDSPDDLSFFGGQQSVDALAPSEGPSSSTGETIDVVDEVVEVLDDEDIFAEEVVEAAVVEESFDDVEVLDDEPVEVMEVLDDEPLEVVELLDDEAPANALTADLEESDLLDEQFIEVLEEPEEFAEELVEAELIEEPAEVLEVLEVDESVEVVEAVSIEPRLGEGELVEVLEEPSDFFDQLGIAEEEPQQAIEQVAEAEVKAVAAAAEESAETDWFSDAAEDIVDVIESPPAEAVDDEVELFDDADVLNESTGTKAEIAHEDSVRESSSPEAVTLEHTAILASESSNGDGKLSELAEPSFGGEFDFLNDDHEAVAVATAAEIEPTATAAVDATIDNVTVDNATIEEYVEFEPAVQAGEEVEQVTEVGAVSESEAAEEFDFFDEIETVEPSATAEKIEAAEEFKAEVEEAELFEEVAEADIVTEPIAEVTQAAIEEAAIEEAAVIETDGVEEAWDFAEVELEDTAAVEDSSPEEVAAEEVAAEEVAAIVEEDEESNWFDIGDDKGDDEDDPELRKFLKGF